jgi:molecular chaperone GrpE
MPEDRDVRPDSASADDEQTEIDQPQSVNLESGDEQEAVSVDEQGADTSVPEGVAEEEPAEQIARLEAELAELKDQYLRKSADFENYRKRVLREKSEFAAYATRELLLDIVTIIDDFERAIKSADESQDFTAFHDGVVMIEQQFTSMLERKWKLTRFDSVGEEFDPQRHEAMMTDQSSECTHPTVAEDFQKGYLLEERVLRPAKVKVTMPAAEPAEREEPGGATPPDADKPAGPEPGGSS